MAESVQMPGGEAVPTALRAAEDVPAPLTDEQPIIVDTPSAARSVAEVPAATEAQDDGTAAVVAPESALVERVGSLVFERMAAWLATKIHESTASAEAALAAAEAALAELPAKVTSGERPTVRFVQKRRTLAAWPRPLDNGDIALHHNPDPSDPTSTEIHVLPTGHRIVDFGFRVEIPPGWVADVTVEGVAGQRVVCGTLAGSTSAESTLKLALRTNRPTGFHVTAGSEIARLHLRRSVVSSVRFVDAEGVESAIGADGAAVKVSL